MLENHTVAAVIVAAGASRRMGFDKLFAEIDGEPVLWRTLAAFDAHPAVDELVVVAGQNADNVRPLLRRVRKPCRMVAGGETRAKSVENGLSAVTADYVAIHDAARPFVSEKVISDALEMALTTGAAAPAVPVKDTVKIADANGVVQSTPRRDTLFAVQTPQCFYTPLYRQVLKAMPEADVTDDCSLFEQAGLVVQLTQGEYANYKITTPEDLPAPACGQPPAQEEEADMAHLRIGHGYDVHRLVSGRPLVLGGVQIPFEKGLLGHSDADVLVHAVMDALLGAAALGDIGHLFPDNDPAYEGADSVMLLREVGKVLRECGYTVQNIDATVLCQAPKLAPHIVAMRANIAGALGMETGEVSVKATTEERLGFTGAGEGIAAHAVCLLAGKK